MEISPITSDDITQIISLTMEHLTRGDYVADMMSQSAQSGNYFGFKVEEDGEMKGFLTYKRGIEFTLPHPEMLEEISSRFPEKEVFTGDSFYVDSSLRRRGIGRELMRLSRDRMLQQGGRYFLEEMWVYPDGKIPAKSPTDNFGETVYERLVPGFYRELHRYGMCCPVCGEDCRCGAFVRVLELKGDSE
jgi:GNAT superfamily N-acetyltransferase